MRLFDACTECENPAALLRLARSRVTRSLTPAERQTYGVNSARPGTRVAREYAARYEQNHCSGVVMPALPMPRTRSRGADEPTTTTPMCAHRREIGVPGLATT
jgi:hypothetical protein